MNSFSIRRVVRKTVSCVLFGFAGASSAFAQFTSDAEVRAQESWRDAMHELGVTHGGCFTAAYPQRVWKKATCVTAPDALYLPRAGVNTAGAGQDFAATTTNLTQVALGSFPVVTGVKSEMGDNGKNSYSIQLNSNFMTGTAACAGHPGCRSWQQYIYSSSYRVAFMQYWLLGYGNSCPSGWGSYSSSCYRNSAAVSVPRLAIGTLKGQKMSGAAVDGGIDTLVFTHGKLAYSTTESDSLTNLGSAWKQSEFNIIGDGNGSMATFNPGSSITVKIAVTDGTTKAPACAANAGTTGETNNLNLGACTAVGGPKPYVQFVQSN
jgi:hypothetical protein